MRNLGVFYIRGQIFRVLKSNFAVKINRAGNVKTCSRCAMVESKSAVDDLDGTLWSSVIQGLKISNFFFLPEIVLCRSEIALKG